MQWVKLWGVVGLLGVVSVIVWQAPTTDARTHRLTLRQVDGLQIGDAVYLRGLRVGQVRGLELAGSRVRVTLEIDALYRDAIPQGSHYLLWRDTLDPRRRAIRIQPGAHPGTPEPQTHRTPRRR